MNPESKTEMRVGLFVFAGLLIIAGMILQFGRIEQYFHPTYRIELVFDNIGGLITRGNVLYSGVKVGRVQKILLDPKDQQRVHVIAEINRDVKIRRDARFVIRTAGVLGEQYIHIEPVAGSQAPFLRDGEKLAGESPVDFGAVADRIQIAMDRVNRSLLTEETLQALRESIANARAATDKLNQQVLGEQALDDYRQTLAGLRAAAESAKSAAAEVETLAQEAREPLEDTLERFRSIAAKTESAVETAEKILRDNEQDFRDAMSSAADATERMQKILANLQAGEGTLGQLITDKELHESFKKLIENWRRHGLLYKEPRPRSSDEQGKSYSSPKGLRQNP